MFDYVLFDLDGTLTNPYRGITNSVIYAAERFGIAIPPREELKSFIGPPIFDSFVRFFGLSESDANLAVAYYREYFSDRGIFENVVYDGVDEVLSKLIACGKRIILATSKPEKFAKKILEHFDLEKYFTYVAGASMDKSRAEKAAVIAYALDQAKISNGLKAVMVGDRKHDIFGARQNGLKSVGVLYGYGSLKELQDSGADYLANIPQDICKIVK